MKQYPRIVRLGVPALILVLVGGFAVYKLVLEVEAPDEVTTDTALEQLAEDLAAEDLAAEDDAAEDDATGDGAADDTGSGETADATDSADGADAEDAEAAAEPTSDGVIGTWVVDDDFGEFDFDSASGSFAGFRVAKSLFTGQGVTAVGRTGGVTGSVVIGDGELTSAEITVDMTSIVSDESGRESAIRNAVSASEFPAGSFVLTAPVVLDTDALLAGETVSADITGELTIAGVTQTVAIAIEATVPEAGVGLVIGTADLVWADFDVETPTSIAGTVADEGILEFQLVVRPG